MDRTNRTVGIVLFFTLTVIMLGFGMIIPILPFFIDSLGASGGDLGLLMATYALTQFLFAPLWGAASDRIGRKPILMMGVLGNGLAMLMFGLSTQLWMLFLARALAGVLSAATLPTSMAYIGETTSEEDRGGGMGMIGAAMGLGMVLGPGLGGWLAEISFATPFFVAAALSLVAMLLVLLFLPASGGRAAGAPEGVSRNGIWAAARGPLGVLLGMAFLVNFAMGVFSAVFGLYAMVRFAYGPPQVGTVLVAIGIVSTVVQGGLAGRVIRRWGEAPIIRASLLLSAAGFVVMLWAASYLTILLTTGFFILGVSLLTPAVSALTSRSSPLGQGITMGLSNSAMSLGRVIGPVLGGFLFDFRLDLPYLMGAAILLVGFVVSLEWLRPPAFAVVAPPPGGEAPG